MKSYKLIVWASIALLSTSSCDSFLDKVPHDSLSPSTFWQTEKDVYSAVTACYEKWSNPVGSDDILFADCMSDIAYKASSSGNYKFVANGTMSQTRTMAYYDYSLIRRCNTFFAKTDKVDFDEKVKNDLFAQVRTIRAYRYFQMNFWYGGVPLITDLPETAAEAQVERSSEEKIKEFVYNELDQAIPMLNIKPAQKGRIARGTALAVKMRAALYWGDYQKAREAANAIRQLDMYELDPDFLEMFTLQGQTSKEIIYAMQHVPTTFPFENCIRLFNNADGGWASMVPTSNLVDMFEMKNGLMPDEPGSGYDPEHPFANRDPRLAQTVIYPGMDWLGKNGKIRVFNTLDKKINGASNPDFYNASNNASKTGMIWAKYTVPISQYSASLSNEALCPILFRYAEVLLTIAEANVELNENLDEALDIIDQLRVRGGMSKVNRSKYVDQKSIRALVRRERTIELAGEGMRRADIVRWKDDNGKMVAHTVLNGTLYRIIGTVNGKESNPEMRARIEPRTSANEKQCRIEDRVFNDHNRYLPFSLSELEKNPKLKQNDGYAN